MNTQRKDAYRPLLSLGKVKDKTYARWDRMDLTTCRLVFISPQRSFEFFPPIVIFLSAAYLVAVGMKYFRLYPFDGEQKFLMPTKPLPLGISFMPTSDKEMYLGAIITTIMGIAAFFISKGYPMRIYWNARQRQFIAVHRHPITCWVRRTPVLPGSVKESKRFGGLKDVPGLRIPQSFDPEYFKAPIYYNVLMGFSDASCLNDEGEDGGIDFF
ncbi:uncharacterized protein LOC100905249 [Galendromus occidentalis]|uniref:Uncharacterized protein LOC100905249 n=1 Tax=Galendromus occidentalis TaxID=34638 RepID=A0AAJ6QWD3_9ACAR|nr:uncharacterized protein LOC100905249 [Galendromus occidentalis]